MLKDDFAAERGTLPFNAPPVRRSSLRSATRVLRIRVWATHVPFVTACALGESLTLTDQVEVEVDLDLDLIR